MLAPSALLARRALVGRATRASRRRSARAARALDALRRGSSRARRSGSRARPSTCGRRSPGGCARAPRRRSRPSRADALLLGGSVFDLLAREEGERAAIAAVRAGPDRALEAFGRAAAAHRAGVAVAPLAA